MDEQHQNARDTGIQGNLKRIFGPPAIVVSCWSIFTYGGVLQFLNPKWDYITGFSFGALAFGFLVLPFVVLSLAFAWRRASSDQKSVARSYFIGWASAWVLLILGFMFVPWGKGWP